MQQATVHNDPEAVALAACYRLLIEKARERRARLAMQAESEGDAAALPDRKVNIEDRDAAAKVAVSVG